MTIIFVTDMNCIIIFLSSDDSMRFHYWYVLWQSFSKHFNANLAHLLTHVHILQNIAWCTQAWRSLITNYSLRENRRDSLCPRGGKATNLEIKIEFYPHLRIPFSFHLLILPHLHTHTSWLAAYLMWDGGLSEIDSRKSTCLLCEPAIDLSHFLWLIYVLCGIYGPA